MYTDIIVLTYQGPDIGAFTYEIPKNLNGLIKPGHLVLVPFGSRNPFGVVTAIGKKQKEISEKIKKINSLIFPHPLLLPYQLDLLKWMSFYYHAPLVNCLEAILPEIPTKVQGLTTNAENISVQHSTFSVQQTLVLIPSINRLPETMAKFPQAKNFALYHNELKTSEKFQTWMKILSGNVDYIFGSRSAIFTPCPNLYKIVIFDEHDNAYKDERSPYFDTLTVAEKLQEQTGAKLEIVDSSPKITAYFTHKNEVKIPKLQAKTKIISMQKEKMAGNKSPISDLVSEALKRAQKKDKKVLLFLNKKKESGSVYCKSCHHHEFAQKQPNACPNCQSQDIWFNSLNINSLAAVVHQIVPSVSVNVISDGIKPSAFDVKQSHIDIATASIFYAPRLQKYDLAVHILADSLLNISDFSSTEKLYSQIANLKKLTAKNGLLILQVYDTENLFLDTTTQGNYLEFATKQISQRKILAYPPFALLIKLTLKGKSEEKISQEAENLAQNLHQLPITKYQKPLTVLGPYQSLFWQQTSSYNIILKYKLSDYSLKSREKAIENLKKLLEEVPKNWQITIEPSSIN